MSVADAAREGTSVCRFCTARPVPAALVGRAGVVYVLHFDRQVAVSSGYTTAHYVGWTLRLARRLREHRRGGTSAAMVTRLAHEQGVSFTVANVCPGTVEDERRTRYHGTCGNCGDRLTTPAVVQKIDRLERRGGDDATSGAKKAAKSYTKR